MHRTNLYFSRSVEPSFLDLPPELPLLVLDNLDLHDTSKPCKNQQAHEKHTAAKQTNIPSEDATLHFRGTGRAPGSRSPSIHSILNRTND